MKRRKDIVKELYLDDRLEVAERHTVRPADDVRLSQRRVKHAGRAKFSLQVGRYLKDAALALDLVKILLTRTVSDVLAENDDPLVTLHLLVQAAIDQIDHRAGVAVEFGTVLGVKQLTVGRVDIGRKYVAVRRFGGRLRRFDGDVGGGRDLGVDLVSERFELLGRGDALGHQKLGKFSDRIGSDLGLEFVNRAIELFVVGQRVRIRPDHLSVDKGRALALAAIGDRTLHCLIALEHVGSVTLLNVEARKSGDELGDIAAGGADLDRGRDGVTVVLDHKDDRQLEI